MPGSEVGGSRVRLKGERDKPWRVSATRNNDGDVSTGEQQMGLGRSLQGFGTAAASGERTGFRSTSTRSGTGPALDWRNYPDTLTAITERLQGVVIDSRMLDDLRSETAVRPSQQHVEDHAQERGISSRQSLAELRCQRGRQALIGRSLIPDGVVRGRP